MMGKTSENTDLFDPRSGGEALRFASLRCDGEALEPARTNYFAVYRIKTGVGSVAVDDGGHRFGPSSLLFVTPYQYLRFSLDQPVIGEVIEFHANFLCVETFHAESGCAGSLFNDPYGVPVLPVDPRVNAEVTELFARIGREQVERGLAYSDASLAYLKVLLIVAARSKAVGETVCGTTKAHRHPDVLRLSELIEERYRTWHSPAEYAKALHMTAKTLGRVVREVLGTTPTNLIQRRILTHAKWHLLHTLKPVKEVAREVGYNDELYFSRMFKKATGVSPTYFREFETAIRGGSNLSMSSSRPSIPRASTAADN